MFNLQATNATTEKEKEVADYIEKLRSEGLDSIADVLGNYIPQRAISVGKGLEKEYKCPKCGTDLFGYERWSSIKYCELCGKKIMYKRKDKQCLGYRMDYHG